MIIKYHGLETFKVVMSKLVCFHHEWQERLMPAHLLDNQGGHLFSLYQRPHSQSPETEFEWGASISHYTSIYLPVEPFLTIFTQHIPLSLLPVLHFPDHVRIGKIPQWRKQITSYIIR